MALHPAIHFERQAKRRKGKTDRICTNTRHAGPLVEIHFDLTVTGAVEGRQLHGSGKIEDMAALLSFSPISHTHPLPICSYSCSCNPRSIATVCPSSTPRLISAGAATVDHFTAPVSCAAVNLLREFSLSGSSGPGGPSGRPGRSFTVPRIGSNGRSSGVFPTEPAEIPRSVRKEKEAKNVTLVDPVEAKRLAAVEMTKILAAKRYKRKREIEAINGGWAVLGLTAGIVIDGLTGKSILAQFAGYLDAVNDFVTRITPS